MVGSHHWVFLAFIDFQVFIRFSQGEIHGFTFLLFLITFFINSANDDSLSLGTTLDLGLHLNKLHAETFVVVDDLLSRVLVQEGKEVVHEGY